MTYSNSKYVTLGEKTGTFSLGYIDNTQNLYLSEGASPYLRNARLDGNSIIIRPGHSLFSELTTGDYPRGIGRLITSDPANARLVVRHNQDTDKKLVTLTEAGVLAEIDTSTDITSDNRMIFSNVGDVIYCMNGVDNFGKLSGTTYTTPNTGIASFAPSFAVSFNGSHWASGWGTNPSKVYKSVADNYEDFNSTGSDVITFQEKITGLSANLEALMYFTKNSISITGTSDITDTAGTITYVVRALNAKEGAVNHSSIVEAGNRTFFVTPTNKICQVAKGNSIDGYEVLELSERKYKGISTIMSTLDKDQTNSFGYFLPKENLVKWFFKSAGGSFNDTCIIYDITKDAFLVDGQKYFFDGVNFNGVNYTISNIESKVYKDEYAQDDEDSPIPFEYWTKEFYVSDPSYKKLFRESRTLLDINELAELTQDIYIDGGKIDTKTVDKDNISVSVGGLGVSPIGETPVGEGGEIDTDLQEIYILRTKGNLNVRGRKIQFRFKNNSLAGKIRLKDIGVRVEGLPGLTNNITI